MLCSWCVIPCVLLELITIGGFIDARLQLRQKLRKWFSYSSIWQSKMTEHVIKAIVIIFSFNFTFYRLVVYVYDINIINTNNFLCSKFMYTQIKLGHYNFTFYPKWTTKETTRYFKELFVIEPNNLLSVIGLFNLE